MLEKVTAVHGTGKKFTGCVFLIILVLFKILLYDPVGRGVQRMQRRGFTPVLCWHIRTNRVPNIRIYSENFSVSEYSAYSDTLNRLAHSHTSGTLVWYSTAGLTTLKKEYGYCTADRSQDHKT